MTLVAESLPPTGADVHQARRLVALLVLVASTGYLCRVDITVVAPLLMAEFHLSQAQMGQIFSAFLVGYTVFQVPSGWIADRVKTRPLFLSLTLGWALLTAATTFVGRLGLALRTLPALLLLRTAFGIVAAPTYPTAGRAIAVSVAPPLQGRSNGAVLASIGVGSAVAPPLLGFATARWGWRPGLLLCAAIAALVAVIWRAFAPDVRTLSSYLLPPEGTGYSSRPEATGEGATLRSEQHVGNAPSSGKRPSHSASPFRQRSFWFLVASYLLQGYVGYVFVFWFYLYLVQVRHFNLLRAAWLTTLPWACSLIAIPVGGILSDWAVNHWGATWGRRAVPLPALLVASGLLVIGARTDSPRLAVTSLTLSTVLVLVTEGPFWATMAQISGSQSGVGGGVMNFGSNLGGMLSPTVTPWLAGLLGWETALSLTALLAVLGAALWMGVGTRQSKEIPG